MAVLAGKKDPTGQGRGTRRDRGKSKTQSQAPCVRADRGESNESRRKSHKKCPNATLFQARNRTTAAIRATQARRPGRSPPRASRCEKCGLDGESCLHYCIAEQPVQSSPPMPIVLPRTRVLTNSRLRDWTVRKMLRRRLRARRAVDNDTPIVISVAMVREEGPRIGAAMAIALGSRIRGVVTMW
jgi:hypothetical protein